MDSGITTKNVSQLKFDENGMKDWKWNNLCDTESFPDVSFASCLSLDEKLLYIIGGYHNNGTDDGYTQRANLYDISCGEWKKMEDLKHERYAAGIYYDDGTIYIGGGMVPYMDKSSDFDSIEYYDLHKNKWYRDIPNTSLKHEDYPLIWKDGINNNVLCIASMAANGLECIDLRMKNKRWNFICEPMITQSLCDIFECDDKSSDYSPLSWSCFSSPTKHTATTPKQYQRIYCIFN